MVEFDGIFKINDIFRMLTTGTSEVKGLKVECAAKQKNRVYAADIGCSMMVTACVWVWY